MATREEHEELKRQFIGLSKVNLAERSPEEMGAVNLVMAIMRDELEQDWPLTEQAEEAVLPGGGNRHDRGWPKK